MLFMSQAELVPTDFALKMRIPFLSTLLVLAALAICKVIISDYWGAINTVLVIVMGFFVVAGEYSVNASSALLFCVMAVVSGIFDVISCVLYFQHSKYGMFEAKAPGIVILAQVTFLLCPAALFVSATVAYAIFGDCRDQAMELYEQQQNAYGSMGWGDSASGGMGGSQTPSSQQLLRQAAAQQSTAPAPVHFQGQGRRLGEVLAEGSKEGKEP